MIDKIVFKAGTSAGQPPLEVDLTPLTVIVGPNNSGKSLLLSEIDLFCASEDVHFSGMVLDRLKLTSHTREAILELLESMKQEPTDKEKVLPGNMVVGKVIGVGARVGRQQVNIDGVINHAANPHGGARSYLNYILNMHKLVLDAGNRMSMVASQNAGDLKAQPQSPLRVIFDDNELRTKIRSIVFDAFGKYFVLDATNTGKIEIRYSNREPVDEAEEKNWDSRAVTFHKEATSIQQFSDGVKAFTGIITSLFASGSKIVMTDEPEAFLHPSLSNRLGYIMGEAVRGSDKRVFASSHSSSFLMGCIESGCAINVVRLTYNDDAATARVLPKDKIQRLMRNPLLRSVGVLDGLFYSFVIVTEADADRAFYQEINLRCLSHSIESGVKDCIFLNANGKHTIWDVVTPLRELGIPAAAIVDIDIIKEGGTNWSSVLNSAGIPEGIQLGLQTQRQAFKKKFDETGKDMKREGGIALLNPDDQEAFQSMIDTLGRYGVFVVPNGEVESWLPDLEVTRNKRAWLREIFEKMGENPEEVGYVKFDSGDVWDFMGRIRAWMVDAERKGITD